MSQLGAAGAEKMASNEEEQIYSVQNNSYQGPPTNGSKSNYGAMGEPQQSTELDEHGVRGPKTRITPWQAAWNVTNAIQGMFIVSLPYAVLHGGWWAVLAMVGVAWICYHTGMLLVECLYDEQGNRIRSTYRDVAEAVWGSNVGGRVVLSAQITELLMTCILYIVLAGDLLESAFPDQSMTNTGWMIVAAAMLVPCSLLKDITAVSHLSFWNGVSHLVINGLVVFYCLTRISTWSWGSVAFTFDMHTFATVLGIIVFSYTDHIFLPTLEGSLDDRTKFQPMLKWTHITAAACKGGFGLIGFLTFAEDTSEEIPNNLPSQNWKMFVNVVLVVKALLSYPLPFYATANIIEQNLFLGRPATALPSAYYSDGSLREWAIALRVLLVLFTLVIALIVPQFALLMGLIGNVTGTCLSFIWPSYFHLKLKKEGMAPLTKWINTSIICLGIAFGLCGLTYSSQQLVRALYAVDEYQ